MKKEKARGVTLLELLIVIVILGILASIAIPSYLQYILRSHRVDARNTLQTVAQKIEQNYKITRSYDTLASDVGGSRMLSSATLAAWGLDSSPKGASPRYQIEVFSVGSAEYVLRAVAVGAQIGDRRCAEFFLNQSGMKSARASGDATTPNSRSDASIECWSK